MASRTPALPCPSKGAGKSDPLSPCIDVCRMNSGTGLCEGCLRTLDEIAAWSTLSPAQKRAVLEQLPSRKAGP
jgi:predicted Fe-S protein YdhL (DUF1289 family)